MPVRINTNDNINENGDNDSTSRTSRHNTNNNSSTSNSNGMTSCVSLHQRQYRNAFISIRKLYRRLKPGVSFCISFMSYTFYPKADWFAYWTTYFILQWTWWKTIGIFVHCIAFTVEKAINLHIYDDKCEIKRKHICYADNNLAHSNQIKSSMDDNWWMITKHNKETLLLYWNTAKQRCIKRIDWKCQENKHFIFHMTQVWCNQLKTACIDNITQIDSLFFIINASVALYSNNLIWIFFQ